MASSCLVKDCPALASDISQFGYCPVHHAVASKPAMFDLAKSGKMTAKLKEFVEDIGRGIYPSAF